MKLENVFPHKKNTNVTVNSTIYRIGPGGFIETADGIPFDVPDEDAYKLLQGRAWRELSWDPTDPKNASRFASLKPGKPGGTKGRAPRSMQQMETDYGVKLQETKGELAKGPVQPAAALDSNPDAVKDLNIVADQGGPSDKELERLAKADRTQVAQSAKQAGASEETETTAATATYGGDAAIGDGRPAAGNSEWSVPEDGNWPDPSEEMSIGYLHEMADAYEVKYSKRLGKAKLIKRINDEMYPEILE